MNSKQISYLRGLAHPLNPVVMISNKGLSESVMKEINVNLDAHELIKIKVMIDDKAIRSQMLTDICTQTGAVAVHQIGKQLVVYRQSTKPKIVVPQK
ncbi:MAG: YhbY family RNA-binding protein [Methylotenera sp.]|nr:YhbY family RNA-binding protein [Methylotenera sp.]MSP99611.1 YhbY family RNA-binding protein [Methylotenera sp.]